MTPEMIAELKRLHEAATPGPWIAATVIGDEGRLYTVRADIRRGTMRDNLRTGHVATCIDGEGRFTDDMLADVKLIAAIRNALPDLLAAVEERDRLKANLEAKLRTALTEGISESLLGVAGLIEKEWAEGPLHKKTITNYLRGIADGLVEA